MYTLLCIVLPSQFHIGLSLTHTLAIQGVRQSHELWYDYDDCITICEHRFRWRRLEWHEQHKLKRLRSRQGAFASSYHTKCTKRNRWKVRNDTYGCIEFHFHKFHIGWSCRWIRIQAARRWFSAGNGCDINVCASAVSALGRTER